MSRRQYRATKRSCFDAHGALVRLYQYLNHLLVDKKGTIRDRGHKYQMNGISKIIVTQKLEALEDQSKISVSCSKIALILLKIVEFMQFSGHK